MKIGTARSPKEWLIWNLRRMSYLWPPRQEAFRRARASIKEFKKSPGVNPKDVSVRVKNFFRCEGKCGKVYPRKHVSADHKIPVVNPKTGFVDWNEYIKRLFCRAEDFQIICTTEHDEKTARERKIRQKYKEAA